MSFQIQITRDIFLDGGPKGVSPYYQVTVWRNSLNFWSVEAEGSYMTYYTYGGQASLFQLIDKLNKSQLEWDLAATTYEALEAFVQYPGSSTWYCENVRPIVSCLQGE